MLGAGGDSAQAGKRQPQVLVGVDWGVVDTNFIVEMRPSGASA